MVKTLEDIKKNSACVNDELDEDFSNLHIHLRSPSAYQVLLLNGLVEEYFGIMQTLITQALVFISLCLMI